MKKVSVWLLIHLHTAASTSVSDEKCWPFNISFKFGNKQNLTVPNLGSKEGVEQLWISGLTWRPEFVHCNMILRCRDAKETCFFPAWFCVCVAWFMVRLHTIPAENHRRSFSQKFRVKQAPCVPKDGEHEFFCWLNSFEFLYTRRTWMTIFHGLPFVFRVWNPGFVSNCNILFQKHQSLLCQTERCFCTKIDGGAHY